MKKAVFLFALIITCTTFSSCSKKAVKADCNMAECACEAVCECSASCPCKCNP